MEGNMTAGQIQSSFTQPDKGGQPSGRVSSLWHENFELLLSVITLVALLIGWLGGPVTGMLPQWAVTVAALIAFAAGGYSGLMGAIEQAKHGKLDIDFLMIAAALGAALIGQWAEG